MFFSSLFLMFALSGVCLPIIFYQANMYKVDFLSDMQVQSLAKISALKASVTSSTIPVSIMLTTIMANPFDTTILISNYNTFGRVAINIEEEEREEGQSVCSTIEIAPNGVIQKAYPLAGNEKAINIDLFATSQPRDPDSNDDLYKSPNRHENTINIIKDRGMFLNGPLRLAQGYDAIIISKAVFVKGVNADVNFLPLYKAISNCDPAICYNSTSREKVWGIVTGIVKWDMIKQSLQSLESQKNKYAFKLSSFDTKGENEVIFLQSSALYDSALNSNVDPFQTTINTFNLQWSLFVKPVDRNELIPEYRNPLIIAVVVVSVLLSLALYR